jgi:hypothetical protein
MGSERAEGCQEDSLNRCKIFRVEKGLDLHFFGSEVTALWVPSAQKNVKMTPYPL